MIDTTNLKCPKCGVLFDNLKGATAPGGVPEAGDGFLCPCGYLGELTSEGGFVAIDESKMSREEQADLNFARRALGITKNGSQEPPK